MNSDRKLSEIFTAAIPFVTARSKKDGGFGATPMLPATIEDTYHALKIRQLARKYDPGDDSTFDPSADENLLRYLEACRHILPTGVRTTFQLLWCCWTAGLELSQDIIETTVIPKMQASDSSIEEWYYCARIHSEVLGGKSSLLDDNRNITTVLDRGWRTVQEAWMHLYLSWKFWDVFPKPTKKLITWFQACQNGDGGFGFFPGTTSFIENCHACLRALTFWGVRPLHPDQAFSFLTGCQTGSGGFGRSSRAAPFLDATWHGLDALALIGGQDS